MQLHLSKPEYSGNVTQMAQHPAVAMVKQ